MEANDEAKSEFQKAVMRRKEEKQEENLETIQEDIKEAAGKVAHSTKKRNEKDQVLMRRHVMCPSFTYTTCTQRAIVSCTLHLCTSNRP